MEDNKLEFLRMLIEKHKEQSELFYTRSNTFLLILGFLVAAIMTAIISGTGNVRPRALWVIAAVLSVSGAIVSIAWRSILAKSDDWIRFWRAKVEQHEFTNCGDKVGSLFFLDRCLRDSEFRQAVGADAGKQSAFDDKKLREMERDLKRIRERRGGGIGRSMLLFVSGMIAVWFILAAIFVVLTVLGFSLEIAAPSHQAMWLVLDLFA